MSALVILLLLTNGVLLLDLILPEKSGPFQTVPPVLIGLIFFGVALAIYALIRTGNRYVRILESVDARGLSNRRILAAKIVSIAIPVVLLAGTSIMGFVLSG